MFHVRDDAGGANDGTTWADAFADLQDALGAAAPGDEIWVAAGLYRPDRGSGDRTATFQLLSGVGLYGGFAGSETDRDLRDPAANETLLSGDLNRDDDSGGDNGENSYHVVTGSGTNATAVLDGFTITAGNADGSPPDGHDRGGGLTNFAGDPTVNNCTFRGNAAETGAGIYNDGSSPVLTNCRFIGNAAAREGGGLANFNGSRPTVMDCVFTSNTAGVDGGGMQSSFASAATVTNCRFNRNAAGRNSGAIGCFTGSSDTISGCEITENTAVVSAGGIGAAIGSNPTIVGCAINSNRAGQFGGGIAITFLTSPTITDCEFSNNASGAGGGAIAVGLNCSPTINRCTFFGNESANGGGIGVTVTSTATITDSIFFSNVAQINGGAVACDKDNSLTLVGCVMSFNRASRGGGIDCPRGGNHTVRDCTIVGNGACRGGGINIAPGTHVTITDCDITSNRLSDPDQPDCDRGDILCTSATITYRGTVGADRSSTVVVSSRTSYNAAWWGQELVTSYGVRGKKHFHTIHETECVVGRSVHFAFPRTHKRPRKHGHRGRHAGLQRPRQPHAADPARAAGRGVLPPSAHHLRRPRGPRPGRAGLQEEPGRCRGTTAGPGGANGDES